MWFIGPEPRPRSSIAPSAPEIYAFRALHGRIEVEALGEVRGNGARERAAGAVGIGVIDALAAEPLARAVAPEQVVRVVYLMAALAEHGAAVLR